MNIERNRQETRPAAHDCVIKGRRHVDITGVKEVTSFDEASVILITDCGELTLEGDGLRVGTLDTERGIVAVDGNISGVYYQTETKKSRRGLFFGGKDG